MKPERLQRKLRAADDACILHRGRWVHWCMKHTKVLYVSRSSFYPISDLFFNSTSVHCCLYLVNTVNAVWAYSVCFYSLAPVRGLHRLCVLGQRLHGNPFSLWPGSNRRDSSEVLLHWRHPAFAPVSWGGHHKWPCWPAQVQVSATVIFLLKDLAIHCKTDMRCLIYVAEDGTVNTCGWNLLMQC